VVIVAAATFMILYLFSPFDEPEKPKPPSGHTAKPPTGEATAHKAEPTGAPVEDKTPSAEDKPGQVSATPAANTEPAKPVPSPKATAREVGEPLFKQSPKGWRMVLQATSSVETKHFVLKDPPRLALDFKMTAYAGKNRNLEAPPPFIARVRVGEQPDYTRYVIDFTGTDIPSHRVIKGKDGLTVVFTGPAK
jgi:hypothetical protein